MAIIKEIHLFNTGRSYAVLVDSNGIEHKTHLTPKSNIVPLFKQGRTLWMGATQQHLVEESIRTLSKELDLLKGQKPTE